MNKRLSVMGLAARASMVPVLIASGLTALAVGVLTYLANPEHTGGAAGVGAAPLAAAVGYLMVMVMLCLGGCGFGSQTAYTVRRLRLREELVDLWWAAYHAAMLLVLWALVAYLVLYIAALVAWRYPVLREIRAGKRRRPDASIYGWLLRHQPGPLVIRWALLILLLFIVSVVLIQWACPWAASNIPILQSMSNYAVD